MRVPTTTKLALSGVALLAALTLPSCSNTTDGNPTCPGCNTQAEPTVALPPPSLLPIPGPSTTVAPPGSDTLAANDQGYVYVTTKSGKTRCQLNEERVACESQFTNSPTVDGEPANGVSVTSGGAVNWVLGNLGDIPVVTLDYRIYHAQGWTIAADSDGTRFTNDGTSHGMFVSTEGVKAF